MTDPLAGKYLDVWRRPDGTLEVMRFRSYGGWRSFDHSDYQDRGNYLEAWHAGDYWRVNGITRGETDWVGDRVDGSVYTPEQTAPPECGDPRAGEMKKRPLLIPAKGYIDVWRHKGNEAPAGETLPDGR